ncbi:SdrD B-like domain-containing protein [Dinoroseobacter sp. PD6]|uniref:SdrD B-like domain-containing protein n=1 Tax=Dinoroseobacter sp. PD6 TaxID=3028384 RepID=UPI00237C25CA|nr:SdrD B-like domain-containing protein [Dinoroseobacter sp. PD6]MDD9717145.1 SdrD B-like domain-containing protein [Dinoroseobacter sp. PD6]
MTTTYEFTAFSEDDLVRQGTIGKGLGVGDKFVMPAGATYTISTTDDDNKLSGDKDDDATDSTGQYAVVNGVEVPHKQVYIEKYYVLKGSDGKTYKLAEIEIEDYKAPGQGDDFFTFIGDVPPAGVELKVKDDSGSKGIEYAKLGAGPLEGDTGGKTTFVIEAEDMNDNGFRTVHGDQASGGELVKLEGHEGRLSTHFDGPSATYDLTLFAQDECDGESRIKVFINGVLVESFKLDNDNDGGGSDNGGFSAFTIEGLHIPQGAKIEIKAERDDGEWVRIDKIELTTDDSAPANTAPVFDNLPDNGILHVDENETEIFNIDSTDAEGDSFTYSIVGGRDGAMFEIDPHTGELSFKTAKDFENPTSGGNNNTYDVTVAVTDENGNATTKDLWVKVKDVDEPNPTCIVIEAEDMHLSGYSVEHNGDAHGGANIKLAEHCGVAETVFSGPSGTYDLSVFSMDENDGNGAIDVFVNGHYVDTIWLDQGNDGQGGANSGSTFSEDVFQDLMLNTGDVISLVGYMNGGEFARIDKIELCQDGKTCPPDFLKLDFSGLTRGTTVSNQFEGVTITAQKAGDGAGSPNDAMIFDSNNPTGGDHDLGYNGLGNILIISEDNDASDPDDNAHGGVITFDFDAPSDLQNIRLLDIEESGGTIKLFDADGTLIKTVGIPAAGDNSNQLIDLDAADVGSMQIHLVGSGAVDDLCWKPGEPAPEPASIAGRYFCDENDNDVDDGEPGVAGATVELLDAAGNVVATTQTDDTGGYSFTGLDAGTYAVRFAPDATGKTFVAQDVGNDADDSDVDPTTGTTGPITLMAGEDKTDVDAGVEDPGTASVGDTVWFDANGNGLLDGGESGVSGVSVTLTGAGADGVLGTADDTSVTDVTDGNGEYLFEGLDAGSYKVTFDASTTGGLVFTTEGAAADDAVDGDSDADATTGMTEAFELSIGEAERDIDAGLVDPGTATLGGRYFCDDDKDGLEDSGEPGLAGLTVELLDAAGNVVDDTTTGADGSYLFTGLEAGTYSVRFQADPDGKEFVAQNVGSDDTVDSDVDPSTGVSDPVVVGVGEDVRDVDAGVADPGTAAIAGRLFCDEKDDSVDNGEPGVGGVEVALLNAAGEVIGTATTATDGSYEFTGLNAGDYSVRFPTEVDGKVLVDSNVGGDDTIDSDADQGTGETGTITLAIGERSEDNDAGIEDPGTASLAGRYFCDENDNDLDDNEPGIANARVVLLTAAGAFVAETVTAADGSYEFTGLAAGDYKVSFAPDVLGKVFVAQDAGDDAIDSDVDPNTGETGVISVAIGDAITDVDAGVEDPGTASLGDKVFLDANGNGVQDAGEAGVADVTVLLLDETGAVIGTTETDDLGMYSFGGLDAGTYAVQFVEPDGFDFTTPNVGGDDTADSDAEASGITQQVTLAIGENNPTLDAGLVVENGDPTPMDDMGKICANELLTLDVLANDTDPDGDGLTITEVNGNEIIDGQTLEIDGVFVTLNGGSLTFDGEAAFEALDIGEEADVTYSYTVTDGNGGFAQADVDVTFCGTAEDLADIALSLPVQVEYQIIDGYNLGNSDAYTVQLTSTDARLDGLITEAAYCVSAFDPAAAGPDFATAPVLGGNLFVADAALLPDNVLDGQVGINGQSAEENLDLVNWILNQDFESQGFTDAEVQAAIWGLTDSIDFIPGIFGDLEDVREIVALAEANGEGFEAGAGDVVGLIIDPNPATSTNSQPFIIGVEFDNIDCLC